MPKRSSQSHLAGLALYSRNHRAHLDAAVAAEAREPGRRVVLRSQKKWASAERAVRVHGPTAIYFAVVDGGPVVQYEAELIEVQLEPDLHSARTQSLLADAADTTKDEGLWQDQVRTLYAIRGCRRLSEPFPLNELIKHDNGEPLSNDYIRSYARVRRRSPVAV